MQSWAMGSRQVDVLVITALPEEYDAVLAIDDGAVPDTQWTRETGPSGGRVSFRSFLTDTNQPLRVAVALPPKMGAVSTTNVALPLAIELKPQCIAMCGVCAGHRGKTALGDVIAANKVFYHDVGKQKGSTLELDLDPTPLRHSWNDHVKDMQRRAVQRFAEKPWFRARPLPAEWRERRLLHAIYQGKSEPWKHVDVALPQHEWGTILRLLRDQHLLHANGLKLTPKGRAHVKHLLTEYMGEFPDLSPSGTFSPFQLHSAPFATGSSVIENKPPPRAPSAKPEQATQPNPDEDIWGFISPFMRTSLGLDMEAAAIGDLVRHQEQLALEWIVMKGVMDFAQHGRDDHFKEFAARASAECLLWFVREKVAGKSAPDVHDLLVSGTYEAPSSPNHSPSQVLNACYETVPWRNQGRSAVLSDLDQWANDRTKAVSVRLLHGDGGAGKTRLAIEWIKRRKQRHEIAGFLVKEPDPQWLEKLCGSGLPVTIVIDYAEIRRDLDSILDQLSRRAERVDASTPLRLLLLARGDGDWWRSLGARPAIQSILDRTSAQELVSIAPTNAEREEIFQEAAEKFASVFGVGASRTPTPPLDDPRFGRVLYLHMAAMATVLKASFSAASLIDEILRHEETMWKRSSNPHVADIDIQLARQLLASATLLGGIPSRRHAHELADRLLGRKRERAEEEVVALLHRVYSRSSTLVHIPAIEPDLLGEEMILRATKDAHAEWIDQATPDELCTTESTTTIFTVLGRIAVRDNSSRVHAWIDHLLHRDLAIYAVPALRAAKAVTQQTTASPLGGILTQAVIKRGSLALAQAIQKEGIPYPSISLSELDNWCLTALLSDSAEANGSDATQERASLFLRRGRALDSLGRYHDAMVADQESLRLFQSLYRISPDKYFYEVTLSMANLIATSGHAGERRLSLTTAEDLVALYQRQFGSTFPEAALHGLATALNNLANSLNVEKDYSKAIVRAGEAARVWRLLVQRHPGVPEFHAHLATTNFVMSNSYLALGRVEEAATAAEESANEFRRLYLSDRESYASRLGSSLGSLGRSRKAQGLYQEAADALKEAINVCQAISPPIPSPILHELGVIVSDFGETLAAWEQARPDLIEIVRRDYGRAFNVRVTDSVHR